MAERPDACTHEDWAAKATLNRLTDVEDGPITGWSVDFEMHCTTCQTPMMWISKVGGCSRFAPTMSDDGLQLQVPCYPLDVEDRGGTP